MIKQKKYILQTKSKGYSGCYAIALLNALIYYDKPYIISLDDPRWEYLVDKYHCRYGGCLDRKNLRKELGISIKKIEIEDVPLNLPVMISSWTRVGHHASLVIKCDQDKWTIVNYNGCRGKLITEVNRNYIKFYPGGNCDDSHYFYHVSVKEDGFDGLVKSGQIFEINE